MYSCKVKNPRCTSLGDNIDDQLSSRAEMRIYVHAINAYERRGLDAGENVAILKASFSSKHGNDDGF